MLAERLVGALSVAAMTIVEPVSGPRLSILIFHRVLQQPDPLFPGEVDAQRFERICRTLARDFTVLRLGEAVRLRADGRLPPRALCITFDDGYADNASVALPILSRHGLTATFFIATAFLDGGRMWNDTIIETLRRCRLEELSLEDHELGRWCLTTLTQRREAIDALLPKIKYLPLAQREHLLKAVLVAAGHPDLPRDLMMSSAQVQALAQAGMEIGGHTVNHPILTELPDKEAWDEICKGQAALQALVDQPVDVFAYPNGRPGTDYASRHVDMIERAGFRAAVSTAPGVACADASPFELPRFTPWDRGHAAWSARLLHMRMTGRQHVRAKPEVLHAQPA